MENDKPVSHSVLPLGQQGGRKKTDSKLSIKTFTPTPRTTMKIRGSAGPLQQLGYHLKLTVFLS